MRTNLCAIEIPGDTNLVQIIPAFQAAGARILDTSFDGNNALLAIHENCTDAVVRDLPAQDDIR